MSKEIALQQIRIKDPFWSGMQEKITDTVIPFQERVLNDKEEGVEKSHALDNFRIAAGLMEGEFYGMVFQDSDVAKWLEGVAYSLVIKPDAALEQRADDIIDIIAKAQQPDGYLNTFFTIKEPEHRWQNLLECHELYCAGHMMEAAVAYYEATGKDKLLGVMERMAQHIMNRFGEDKIPGIPGHQEVEIGLMRMYHATGKEAYKDMARYFLEERGKNPNFFKEETERRGWTHFGNMIPDDTKYNQSHATIYEQDEAVGHSVRAVYMYTAMADLAAEDHDEKLFAACRRLWENMTQKKMFITGGIGSTVEGEAFTKEYELPNDMNYAETCASIGLVFFARNMLKTEKNGRYADVMERALYNGIISGMQLDGKRFFYVNPLEVWPANCKDHTSIEYLKPVRQPWFEVACCPANIARTLASLGQYIYAVDERSIYVNLLVGSTIETTLRDTDVRIEQRSGLMHGGALELDVRSSGTHPIVVRLRLPKWIEAPVFRLNGEEIQPAVENGYAVLAVNCAGEHHFTLSGSVPVHRCAANLCVRADVGRVALQKGPFVYCFEQQDNGENLAALRMAPDAAVEEKAPAEGLPGNLPELDVNGCRIVSTGVDDAELYADCALRTEPCTLHAVPYGLWGNRTPGEMRVWVDTTIS